MLLESHFNLLKREKPGQSRFDGVPAEAAKSESANNPENSKTGGSSGHKYAGTEGRGDSETSTDRDTNVTMIRCGHCYGVRRLEVIGQSHPTSILHKSTSLSIL